MKTSFARSIALLVFTTTAFACNAGTDGALAETHTKHEKELRTKTLVEGASPAGVASASPPKTAR
jgi:hypothetical protein